jgi:hypothetical protein
MSGLSEALAAEHAAIFGYGVVGSHLTKGERTAAAQAEAAHRARRDSAMLRMIAANATPAPAAAAYELPFLVADRDSAVKLALALEEGTARAWHQALATTTGADRKLALDALTDCAVRATRWRRLAGESPITVAFPGASA